MKILLIGFLIFTSQVLNAQQNEFSFFCNDVKIISEHTGDTIGRCELGLNRLDNLSKLGSNYLYDERMDNELRDLYHFGEDIFHYSHDTSLQLVGFDLFTDKFKILINNQFLVQVGDHIDSCFKQYAPVPIDADRGEEAVVFINYKSPKTVDNEYIESHIAIRFNKETRLVLHIGDYRTGPV